MTYLFLSRFQTFFLCKLFLEATLSFNLASVLLNFFMNFAEGDIPQKTKIYKTNPLRDVFMIPSNI